MTVSTVVLSNAQKSLPTFRCGIDKQIEIVRAVVVFFEKNKTAASYREIAPLADVDPTVVSGTLGFWKDIGILHGEGGKYQPSKALMEIVRLLVWENKDDAWRLFRQSVKDSWFTTHLIMAFQIKKQMSLEELTNSLGNATGISDRDKNTAASVRNLIAFVELSGILTKDPTGSFSLNPDLNSSSQQAITVEDQRPIVLVRIANEVYAVDAEDMKDFVRKIGKLSQREQQLV